MKRHPSLVPLSHDHHHTLVEARRLRRAAGGDPAARRAAAASFLRFFAGESVPHFRREEERFFPLLAGLDGPAGELLVKALLEHQRAHALAAGLDRDLAAGEVDAATLRELGELLERHVRLEERQLFPLLEEAAGDDLELAASGRDAGDAAVVDLTAPLGRGPLWGVETEDLNATLLAWRAGEGPAESTNAHRDVLVVVLDGSAIVTIDGVTHAAHAGEAVLLEKGRRRSIEAGPAGVRYLTVHLRREPLQIRSSKGR